MEDIVFLDVINIETGLSLLNYDSVGNDFLGGHSMPIVKKYDIKNIQQLKSLEKENKEGFVVKFKSGLRVKVKFDEYMRLHKLLTGFNPKHIWEILSTDGNLDVIENVPDEFHNWVHKIEAQLKGQYKKVAKQIQKDYNSIVNKLSKNYTRKDFALLATKTEYPGLLFDLLDDRIIEDKIWKVIKPKGDAFRTEV